MKVLIFGVGSIGSRHMRNIRELMPLVELNVFDPKASASTEALIDCGATIYNDWKTLIEWNPGADAAIIASPTEAHLEQAIALHNSGIPFYIEKPIGMPDQIAQFARMNVDRCAVGYQYRFHPVYREAGAIIRDSQSVRFAANDDLLNRYGPDCLSYIAAHPIDTALWLLGSAASVDMVTNGLSVYGRIQHVFGSSGHLYRIDMGPRRSVVSTGGETISLDPCNEMYIDALRAWLEWVAGAQKDYRTATLSDGCNALEVMSKVRRI